MKVLDNKAPAAEARKPAKAPRILAADENVAAGILRLIEQDLATIGNDLTATGDRERRVRRVRRRLKRVRTLVRVVQPAFRKDARKARAILAVAGRLLAQTRDTDAAAESARALATQTIDATARSFEKLAGVLADEANAAHQERTPTGVVALRLAAARAHIAALNTDFDGRRLARRAIARTYRRGRQAFRRAGTTLIANDFHEWRKDVKRLADLLRVFERRLPAESLHLRQQLRTLDDLLGRDNDYAELAERLALTADAGPEMLDQLAVIAAQRRKLEADALELGATLYKPKPKRMAEHHRP